MLVWASFNRLRIRACEGARDGIQDWLERLGLEKYAAVFAEHEITLEVLPELTESDIDRLALPSAFTFRIATDVVGEIEALKPTAMPRPRRI